MEIGIIAEENNDVEVIYEVTCKLIDESRFSFKKFVAHGCGRLRRKCTAWAENLLLRGCDHLVVIHDLDNNDEMELRKQLTHSINDIGFTGYVILIPVKEIEAWLLTDPKALQKVFHMAKMPKLPLDPEGIERPKEKLRDVIWKTTRKHYVNTIHNRKIAAVSRISKLKICRSFHPYPKFIASL